MVEIAIPDGKGITHGILKKLQEQNIDTKNMNTSIWNQILAGAKIQNDSLPENQKIYSGGSEFVEGEDSNAKKSWKENFVVAKGAVLTIADDIWKNIVDMVTRGTTPKPSETETIQTTKTEAEQQEFKTVLQDTKNIISENKELLGLTDDEMNYISSASIESIPYGAARYDNKDDSLKFNINDKNPPDKGNFVKTMIHEVTHASKKSSKNTVAEERECETRAIKSALKLLDAGKIDDFKIMGRNLSEFRDESVLNQFIEDWLEKSEYKKRLPAE